MSRGQHELTRHIDRLYRAAWALCGSREDAEDLVQETYAKVFARPRRVRRGRELAYLLRALNNTYVSDYRMRSARPRTVPAQQEALAPALASQPEAALEVHELFAAIGSLPDDFRLALVAVDVIGLSYREAADALGTIEGTITTRLHRARRDVVRALSDGAAPLQTTRETARRVTPAPTGALASGSVR